LAFICSREAWIFTMAVSSVIELAIIICHVVHHLAMRSIQSKKWNPIPQLLTPVVMW
jgi:hypothetical protein